jgi:hypothetical protein
VGSHCGFVPAADDLMLAREDDDYVLAVDDVCVPAGVSSAREISSTPWRPLPQRDGPLDDFDRRRRVERVYLTPGPSRERRIRPPSTVESQSESESESLAGLERSTPRQRPVVAGDVVDALLHHGTDLDRALGIL